MNNHNTHGRDQPTYQPRHLTNEARRDQHGFALVEDSARAAHAELPGNNGLGPDELEASFSENWADSATSIETLVRNLTHIDLVEDAVTALAEDGLPIHDIVHIDYQALAERISLRWDIVQRDHLFHAFEK